MFNPKRNQKIEQAMRAQLNAGVRMAIPANCKMALEAEQQIKLTLGERELNGDPLQKALSFWAFCFVNRVADKCLRQPRFIELRPAFLFK